MSKFKILLKESSFALKRTSKFILSHHEEGGLENCFVLRLKNKKIHICSRCFGIYLGIILGLILYSLDIFSKALLYLLILVFPIFSLIDWGLKNLLNFNIKNNIRVLTGFLLGISYSFAGVLFFKTFPNYYLISIFIFYLIISGVLIKISFNK